MVVILIQTQYRHLNIIKIIAQGLGASEKKTKNQTI
jgi:hypothetical protein